MAAYHQYMEYFLSIRNELVDEFDIILLEDYIIFLN